MSSTKLGKAEFSPGLRFVWTCLTRVHDSSRWHEQAISYPIRPTHDDQRIPRLFSLSVDGDRGSFAGPLVKSTDVKLTYNGYSANWNA